MSDFLSRLAGRVLAAEATIRPRLPALFEPASFPAAPADKQIGPAMPAGRSALTPPPEVGVEESPVLSGTLEPPPILAAEPFYNGKPPLPETARRLERPEPQGENTHSNREWYEPRQREPLRFQGENTPRRVERPEAQGENTHSNPKGYEPRHRETPRFQVEETPPRLETRELQGENTHSIPKRYKPRQRGPLRFQGENTPPRPTQEPREVEIQPAANSTPRSLLPAADNSSRVSSRDPVPVEAKIVRHIAPAPANEEKSPPTINVTIGRIEVRAIHRPEPQRILASPQQLPQPRLSLDDYLAQRRQGRR